MAGDGGATGGEGGIIITVGNWGGARTEGSGEMEAVGIGEREPVGIGAAIGAVDV